eukprot:98786_1
MVLETTLPGSYRTYINIRILLVLLIFISITSTFIWDISSIRSISLRHVPFSPVHYNSTLSVDTLVDGLIHNITTLQSNPVYRVGNILLHIGPKWDQDVDHIIANRNNTYTGTLLHHYLTALHDLNHTYAHFSQAQFAESIAWYLSNHNGLYLPQPNEFIIHIRAGDVVHHEWFLHEPFIAIINRTLAQFRNITQITFLCTLHFGGYVGTWRSFMYNTSAEHENKKRLKSIFRSIINHFGFNQQIRSYQLVSNEDTDRDIITAVAAHYLYTQRCRSSFSKIISVMNQYDGWQRVYDAMDDPLQNVFCLDTKCCKIWSLSETFQKIKHKLKQRYGLLVTSSMKQFEESVTPLKRIRVEGMHANHDAYIYSWSLNDANVYDEIKRGTRHVVWELLQTKQKWEKVHVGMMLQFKYYAHYNNESDLFKEVKRVDVVLNPYKYLVDFKKIYPDHKNPKEMVLEFEF